MENRGNYWYACKLDDLSRFAVSRITRSFSPSLIDSHSFALIELDDLDPSLSPEFFFSFDFCCLATNELIVSGFLFYFLLLLLIYLTLCSIDIFVII